jgi:hypothetical protein
MLLSRTVPLMSSGDSLAGLVPIRQRSTTVWAERRPSHCPAGHRFRPGTVLVSWLTCRCQYPALGHRTWLCRHALDGRGCGLTVHSTPHYENQRSYGDAVFVRRLTTNPV